MRNVELRLDTSVYSWENNQILIQGRPHLVFNYTEEKVVAELLVYPQYSRSLRSLRLLPSPDWTVLDTLLEIEESYYRARIEFRKLSQLTSPSLQFQMIRFNGDTINTVIPLFHACHTQATIPPGEHILYIGEEQVFPLESPLPKNIRSTPTWKKLPGIAYRVTTGERGPQLHLIPLEYGVQTLKLPFQTFRPEVDTSGQLIYQRSIDPFEINVKKGQVYFLPLGKDRVLLSRDERYTEVDVKFEQQVSLNLNKPYRIESQESPGGPLVGELYIKEIQRDNKMLAKLRVYGYHRRSEGPLYLKSQEDAIFLTNFDVLPPPRIEQVEIRKPNGEWHSRLQLKPGDKFDFRIRGESLRLGGYSLEGLPPRRGVDSTEQNDRIVWAGLEIPLDLKRRRLLLTQEGKETGYEINIVEYSRPRSLDFVNVRIGDDSVTLQRVPSPLFIKKSNRDILLSFNRDSIDRGRRLHGPQYLRIEVEVWDKENRLIEKKRVKDICLCVGANSARRGSYNLESCFEGRVSINDLIGTPIYELPAWSQIRIGVLHQPGRYEQEGQEFRFNVVIEKKIEVGLEFSTPVSIVMKRFGTPGTETLNTVNIAALVQIGLYRDRAINQLQPVELGVGVMAVDVFPFSGEGQRDLMLGSFLTFYPISAKQKWNVPLYLGGGYLLNSQAGFFFFGPGLSIRI